MTEEIQALPPLQNWLKTKPLNTQRTYNYWILRLFAAMKTDEHEIIRDTKKMRDEKGNIDELWTTAKNAADNLPESGKHLGLSALRSYLRKSGFYPPDDKIDHKQREKTPGYINVDQVLAIIANSETPYNQIFRLMFRSFMGAKEFLTFNTENTWSKVQIAISKREKDYYRFDYPHRKKNNLPFYTLIPLKTLKSIIKLPVDVPFRTPRGVFLDMSHYLNNLKYLDTAFHDAVIRSKIETSEPPSLHQLRDAIITYGSNIRPAVSDKAAEFAAGHTIDPLGYRQCWRDETWMWEELSKVNPSLEAKGL